MVTTHAQGKFIAKAPLTRVPVYDNLCGRSDSQHAPVQTKKELVTCKRCAALLAKVQQ